MLLSQTLVGKLGLLLHLQRAQMVFFYQAIVSKATHAPKLMAKVVAQSRFKRVVDMMMEATYMLLRTVSA